MSVSSKTLALTDVMRHGKRQKVLKGEVLQSTDDSNHLYLIKSGYVKRYLILNDGSKRVQIVYGPGDIFPLTVAFKALLDQDLYVGPELYYYETVCDSDLYSIDEHELVKSVQSRPELYEDLFSEAGRRLYFNIMRLENLGLASSYQRLAHQLLFYANVFGEETSKGIKIKLTLTHQSLADILSLTRETVSQSMVQLRKAGLIKTGRVIYITNLKKLEKEAYQ